jgi:hypothetical protein
MTTPPPLVDNSVMVGSVVSAEQTVDMPGIDVVTRSRALRAPWWAIVLVVQLGGLDDVVGRLLALL